MNNWIGGALRAFTRLFMQRFGAWKIMAGFPRRGARAVAPEMKFPRTECA